MKFTLTNFNTFYKSEIILIWNVYKVTDFVDIFICTLEYSRLQIYKLFKGDTLKICINVQYLVGIKLK